MPNVKSWDTIKRPNLRITGTEEDEDSHYKGPENIFSKIMEENFPNIKKKMAINVKEVYRTQNRPEKKSSYHIIIKALNVQSKERAVRGRPSTI